MSIVALLIVQLFLLFLVWYIGSVRTKIIAYRYFNPASFIVLFYFLFFIIEQITFVFSGQLIDGRMFPFGADSNAILSTQVQLCVFLMSIIFGLLMCLPFLNRTSSDNIVDMFHNDPTPTEKMWIWTLFISGLVAALYLGYRFGQLSQVGNFRSQLVKSWDGVLATSISFMANFAFTYLLFKYVQIKKYFMAGIITFIFGFAILYTGSRGRFLWPLALAAACLFSARNRLPMMRLAAAACVGLVVLSVMDPLRKYLVSGGTEAFPDIWESVANTFLKRNFDGFSNFNLIVNSGYFSGDIGRAFSGARNAFMGVFYPNVYRSGVAFGSTFPGYFYIAGGPLGVAVFGVIYGLLLGCLNIAFRKISSIWMFIGFSITFTWICAVGGDFVESFGKLFAAVTPAIIMWMVSTLSEGRVSVFRAKTSSLKLAQPDRSARP